MQALFSELATLLKDGRYDEALPLTQRIRAQEPGDEDALVCQAVCCIHLGQFEEASQLFESAANSEGFLFERSYCAYRMRKFALALQLLESHPGPRPRKLLELEAQVRYGLEDYARSADIYQELLTHKDASLPELETNLAAALCMAGRTTEGAEFVRSHKVVPFSNTEQ